jgi:hypothetical protein
MLSLALFLLLFMLFAPETKIHRHEKQEILPSVPWPVNEGQTLSAPCLQQPWPGAKFPAGLQSPCRYHGWFIRMSLHTPTAVPPRTMWSWGIHGGDHRGLPFCSAVDSISFSTCDTMGEDVTAQSFHFSPVIKTIWGSGSGLHPSWPFFVCLILS